MDYRLDDDLDAENALSVIKEEKEELKRLVDICQLRIDEYKDKINELNEVSEKKIGYYKQALEEYFERVEHKATKTQETYKLPSGTLKLKLPSLEYKQDEETLTKWLRDNNYSKYIKTTQKPMWGEFKKVVASVGSKVMTEDGELVEGVEVVEREAKFDIEV